MDGDADLSRPPPALTGASVAGCGISRSSAGAKVRSPDAATRERSRERRLPAHLRVEDRRRSRGPRKIDAVDQLVGDKFNAGTAVTLTATPPAGLQFLNWSGACSGTAPTCIVTMNANTSVQAVFSK